AAAVGPVLNEALTEDLALQVCASASIATSDLYYQAERTLLNSIATVLTWNLDFKKRAYFVQPTLIADQLRLQLGDDGYADFIARKVVPEASQAFRDGSRRQLKRINLRTEVRAGLGAYADRWKFNASDASTHAMDRLTALINRLDILERVVRYYLEPTAAA